MSTDSPVPSWIPKVFYAAAALNWLNTIGTVIDPVAASRILGIAPPNYPFALRALAGLAFMFGFLFFEIARDPVRKRAMIRYAWIEKAVGAVSVTIGFLAGDAPTAVFIMICVGDWAWILPFIHAGRVLDRLAREADGGVVPGASGLRPY